MEIISFGPHRSEPPGVQLDDEQHIMPLAPTLAATTDAVEETR